MERTGPEIMLQRSDAAPTEAWEGRERNKRRLISVGTLLGALASMSCCILPLGLFAVGVSGAWIGNLTALAAYQPIFIGVTLLLLGYGFYGAYWKPRKGCAESSACERPPSDRFLKTSLWLATVLVAAAIAFPYVAPSLLGM